MALKWYSCVVDSRDPQALGRWWSEVLDWEIIFDTPEEVVLIPKGMQVGEKPSVEEWFSRGQGLVFVAVPEEKSCKNRLHLDLAPHTSQDREAEIARLLSMGALKVDIGQDRTKVTWEVLADPEGNEFCVLSSRDM